MLGFLLLSRLAHKLVYYSVALLPFALVFYLCRGFFVGGWPDAATLAAFVAVAAAVVPCWASSWKPRSA